MILRSFYLQLMERLCPKDKKDRIGIEYFDLFNNQFDMMEDGKEPGFPRPAVLLEILPVPWQSVGRHRRIGSCEFILHVGFDLIQETSNIEKKAIRDLGLQHLEMLDKINFRLQGFWGDGFNSISPTGTAHDNNHGALIVHKLPFKTLLTDNSAVHPTVKRRPTLSAEFKNPQS